MPKKTARRPVKTTRTKPPRTTKPRKSRSARSTRSTSSAKKVGKPRRSTTRRTRTTKKRTIKSNGFGARFMGLLHASGIAVLVSVVLGGFFHVWLVPQVALRVDEPQLLLVVPQTVTKQAQVARLLLVRLDPSGEHSVIQLAGNQDVSVGRYGSYKLAMVYPLLELDDQPEQYVRSVYSQVLGVPLHQVVAAAPVIDTNSWKPFAFSQLSRHLAATPWWQIAYALRHQGQLEEQPVSSSDAIVELTKQWPTISSQDAQKCPIAVTNGTTTSGLATYTSELIEHAGGLVIRVATEYDVQPQTSIVVDTQTPECQQVAQTISRFFPSVELIPDTEQLTNQYRARVLVLLGGDMDSFRPTEEREE